MRSTARCRAADLADRAEQRHGINAGLDPHREGFRQHHLDAVVGAVVDELGNRSIAAGAEIAHLVAEQIKDRFASVVGCLLAADPDREFSGSRTLRSRR